MKNLFLCVFLYLATPIFALPQAPIPPQAPPVLQEKKEVPPPSYAEVAKQAISENRCLIVWVALEQKSYPGFLHHVTEKFPGCQQPCIIVAVPYNGILYRRDLSANSTYDQIVANADSLWKQVERENRPQNFLPASQFSPAYTQPAQNC